MTMMGMGGFRKALLGCWLLGAAAGALAQRLPGEVKQALRRADIPVSANAVWVQEVGKRSPRIAVNISQPLNPASIMKLLTTGVALDMLGPAFTWQTTAYAAGEVRDGVLHGDLIIKGSGDPKFVSENLWHFLRQIRAKGIRVIRGDVVLDRSAMESAVYNAGEFDGAPEKAYNAGPDALLFNFKALKLQFSPDGGIGKARVSVDPPLEDFAVAMPELSNGECNGWQQKLLLEARSSGLDFGGPYDASCGEQSWFVHAYWISNDQYFGAAFRQIWRNAGGVLKGDVRSGRVPDGAKPIAAWTSAPLTEIVYEINKFSNNVMARQLLLTLGRDPAGRPATTQHGADVIKGWLVEKHIAAPELVIENGSGLSRVARISAGTMGRFLMAMWRSPRMPEFMSSLPVAAHDGSMRHRLNEAAVAGNAHIKTGGLREVRTIAGYVLAASGKRYVVVHFINHANARDGGEAQDALLQWVYENG